jgi:hypothetical protein
MKCLATVVVLIGIFKVCVALDAVKSELLWQKWKETFNKTYLLTGEEDTRKSIFLETLAAVEENNAKFQSGEVSYRQAIYEHADKSFLEFTKSRTGLKMNLNSPLYALKSNNTKTQVVGDKHDHDHDDDDDDYEYSWKKLGKVSPVKVRFD